VVECGNTVLLNRFGARMSRSSKVKYRMFHGSALAAQRPSNSTVKRKEKFWTTNNEEVNVIAPPNILIIGQDSTTRLNFRRHMTQTVKILESLGAVEMMGYTRGTFVRNTIFDDNYLSLFNVFLPLLTSSWN
jgi:hypothetical protein